MSTKSAVSMVLAAMCVALCRAADLTVEKGSPYTVTASETYDKILASDKITINGSVTLKANSSYALQVDAEADGAGCVDAVQIGAGAKFYSPTMTSANSATGVVAFAGSGAKLDRGGDNSWNSAWFSSGNWELADKTGTGISLAVAGSWSGGAFNASGVGVRLTGTGAVTLTAGWTSTRSQGLMNFNKGFIFANSGTVKMTSEYWGTYVVNDNDVFAPSVAGVVLNRSNYKTSPVTLRISSGKVASIKSLEAYDGGCCDGDGTIRMGADDSDGTLKANIEGSGLTVEKIGSGTLTVSSTTNIPVFSVTGGTAVLKSPLFIGTFSIAEGASATVDGVVVRVRTLDPAAMNRISLVNGGSIVVEVGSAADEYLREFVLRDGVTVCKNGAGKAVLCANTCSQSGTYQVKGGSVLFSKRGLTDRYLRFTFKKVLGWINYSNVLQNPGYLRLKQVALFKVDGTRALNDYVTYEKTHDGIKANQLAKGEVSVPEGTIYDSTLGLWSNTPYGLFSDNDGAWPAFANNKLDDASDPTKWQEVIFRLADSVGLLDGYSFLSNYSNGLPTTWTIESSPTGEDGSWRVIANEDGVQFSAAKANHNAGWLDGYAAKGDGDATNKKGRLAMYFNYEEPGVSAGSGSGVTVDLQNGSVFDASNVEDGIGVRKLVYDCTCGGGTLKSVRFVSEGALEIINAGGSRRPVLNISVANPVDVANLENWQVTIDGKVSKCQLKVVDGLLTLVPSGLILIFR